MNRSMMGTSLPPIDDREIAYAVTRRTRQAEQDTARRSPRWRSPDQWRGVAGKPAQRRRGDGGYPSAQHGQLDGYSHVGWRRGAARKLRDPPVADREGKSE